jgi:prepilin-type N-terminal cleavage/methylation domain-containing protein
MNNEKGYSLVELMIVVALLTIIAAIAIPSFVTARMAANEATSIQSLRTVGSAEIAYAATQNQQYTDMTSLVAGGYLDSRFTGTGYINGFTYTPTCDDTITGAPLTGALTPPTNFGVLATPNTGLGRYTYGIAPDQVVRFEGVAAGSTYPAGSSEGSPIGKTT